MKKLRFFGLLVVVLLLAFILVAACDNGSTGPGEGPGDGPGTGPDTEGPAYSVPKDPGFTPTEPEKEEEKEYLITIASLAANTSGSAPANSESITITFSDPIIGLSKDEVKFSSLSGGVVEADGNKPLYMDAGADASGKVWVYPLDKTKSKAGLLEVRIERKGVTSIGRPVLIVEAGSATLTTVSITSTPGSPSLHITPTTQITVTIGGDGKGGFNPANDLTFNWLDSKTGLGVTTAKLSDPIPRSLPDPTTWDYNVESVEIQGVVEIFNTNPKFAPGLAPITIADKVPIGYSVSAVPADGKTTSVLKFEFNSDPRALAAEIVKGDIKISPSLGTGSITQNALSGGTSTNNVLSRKTDTPPFKYELTLTPGELPKIEAGSVYIYIDKAGILTTTSPNNILQAKPVTLERAPRAGMTVTPGDWLGVTTALKLTFDDEIDGLDELTYADFEITETTTVSANQTGAVTTVGGSTEIGPPKQEGDKYVYTITLDARSVVNPGKIKFRLDPSGSSYDDFKTVIDPAAQTVDINYKPSVTYTVGPPTNQDGYKTGTGIGGVTGVVRVWITFSEPMYTDETRTALLAPLVNGDFTLGPTSLPDTIKGSAALTGTPKWIDASTLEVSIGTLTGIGESAGDKGKATLTLVLKDTAFTTAPTMYFIDKTRLRPQNVAVQFEL